MEYKGNQAKIAIGAMVAATLFCPTALPETVTLFVADTDNPQAADYHALRNGAADVIAVADKAVVLPDFVASAIKLVAGVAVAADRVFVLQFQLVGDLVG